MNNSSIFWRRSTLKKHFTMIEVLIIIVILSILFAIILPRLHRSREYAKEVVCMNNIKQIGQAFHDYKYDHNDEWPMAEYFLDDFKPIFPYVQQSKDVFKCTSLVKDDVVRDVFDEEGRLRNGDYMTGGTLEDYEKNNNINAGHGNNPYHFDPSNKSPETRACVAAKILEEPYLYEKRYGNHFPRRFNTIVVRDLHYHLEKEGIAKYWTLNDKGWIEMNSDPFPY